MATYPAYTSYVEVLSLGILMAKVFKISFARLGNSYNVTKKVAFSLE